MVGCGHVSGLLMRQVWPLADIIPQRFLTNLKCIKEAASQKSWADNLPLMF
jgi:hypothetical protein